MNRRLCRSVISVSAAWGALGAYAQAAPPANDTCATATDLNAQTFPYHAVIDASQAGADIIGFPPYGNDTLLNGVWFKYTSSSSGTLVGAKAGSQPFFFVPTLDCTNLLSPDQFWDGDSGAFRLSVAINETVKILVSSYAPAPTSNYDVTFTFEPRVLTGPAPSNDTCATAKVATGPSFTDTVSHWGSATNDVVDIPCSDNPSLAHHGIWYKYTAPASTPLGYQYIRLSLQNSGLSLSESSDAMILAVYSGNCNALAPETLAFDQTRTEPNTLPTAASHCSLYSDGPGSDIYATTGFKATDNTTYYILASTRHEFPFAPNQETATFTLDVATPNLPPNDSCGTASSITGPSYVDSVLIGYASDDAIAACAENPSYVSHGVWYKYTTPPTPAGKQAIQASFQIYNYNERPVHDAGKVISVYANSCSGTPLLCAQNTYLRLDDVHVSFDALSNTTYYFLVGAYSDTYTLPASSYSALKVDVTDYPPPACTADFDGNHVVNVSDIFAFLRAWFARNPLADIDGLNGVNVSDIFAFLRHWFAHC